MVFSSLTFLFFFFPITLVVNLLLPTAARNYWLLVASLVFYAWGGHLFVLVMLFTILMNYTAARLIDALTSPKARQGILTLSIAINLGILFYNKYMNFFTTNLHRLFGASVVVTNIVLPIGISFFTFQAISYVIDVYRGDTPVQKNPFYLGLYIAFFPQLIAGPIVRYRTIAEQIESRRITPDSFADGMYRFCCGLAMKVILANQLSIIVDEAFALAETPAHLSVTFAWLGALCYSLQLLFDFSGYSSMAIGLGKMFGFTFAENFNYPYLAKTVTEFWHRWHISLGQWFRDYVYFPLGGSRVKSRALLVRNLFVVWCLTGIWHGAAWTFIGWGLGYFILLTFEKLTGLAKRTLSPLPAVLYRLFTLLSVMLGWVAFRSDNLAEARQYLRSMLHLAGNAFWDNNALRYLYDYKLLLVLAVVFSTPVVVRLKARLAEGLSAPLLMDTLYRCIALMLAIASISYLVMGGNNPFIYFNF